MNTIIIDPFDPIIARDGRPFGYGAGNKMRCLDWPYPSVMAGTIRTLIGKTYGTSNKSYIFYDDSMLKLLKDISVHGPFPFYDGEKYDKDIFFPAPRDIVVYTKGGTKNFMTLRPEKLREGEGCNIPEGLLPVEITDDVKSDKTPVFWSKKIMIRWLTENLNVSDIENVDIKDGFINTIEKETRVHTEIDPKTFSPKEEKLFSTESLSIPKGVKYLIRAETNDKKTEQLLDKLEFIHPIGGEHRLALFKKRDDLNSYFSCPDEIKKCLSTTNHIRMIIVTPAIFKEGWRPEWIDRNSLEGTPPGLQKELRLKLIGACVDRWKPISGWSLEKGQTGPKPVRRLVNAGSVYFFKVISGKSEDITKLWLQSVSDAEQDRKDGFGITIWGIWKG